MKAALAVLCLAPLALVACEPSSARQFHGHRTFACAVTAVHDGDTFTCAGGIRIRVSGINAREVAGRGSTAHDGGCRPGAPCPTVDAIVARDRLAALVLGRTVQCSESGKSYDRMAAWCVTGPGVDVSCRMVADGSGAVWSRYWRSHRC